MRLAGWQPDSRAAVNCHRSRWFTTPRKRQQNNKQTTEGELIKVQQDPWILFLLGSVQKANFTVRDLYSANVLFSFRSIVGVRLSSETPFSFSFTRSQLQLWRSCCISNLSFYYLKPLAHYGRASNTAGLLPKNSNFIVKSCCHSLHVMILT